MESFFTYYQAESVTKRCLRPGQSVVRQIDVLCCPIDVAPTHPGGCDREKKTNNNSISIKNYILKNVKLNDSLQMRRSENKR